MNFIKDSLLFDNLRVLIAVAESRNFRQAAERLGLSQPAVSLKLQRLEREQSLPLFYLEGKRKVLTHYGRSLYEVAKKSSDHMERALEALNRNYAKSENLSLRLGGRIQVLEYVAPKLSFAGCLELHNCTSAKAVEKLKTHEVDVAVSYRLPDSAELQAKKLFSSRLYFSVHKKFLKDKSISRDLSVSDEFLERTPCVSYGHDAHIIKQWAKNSNVDFSKIRVKYITDDWRTVRALIEEGLGFGFLPIYCQSENKNIKNIEAPAIERLDFYMIFEKNLKKIEAFKSVLAFDNITTI